MKLNSANSVNFGWNIYTHNFMSRKALSCNNLLTPEEVIYVGKHSMDPDLMKEETVDRCSRHFYDVMCEDPSFGMINDDLNNAFSGFLNHNELATNAYKKGDRKGFLTEIARSVHYLQDVSTPMHVEHGNYLHKLFRLPMHIQFEKGKRLGATHRLDVLEKGFVSEEIPLSSLELLFHNTALFTVQSENHVKYTNIKKWFEIQQRCVNRGINASKAYFDYILKFLPKKI